MFSYTSNVYGIDMSAAKSLSEAELNRYDRQIRIWGLESQLKLKSSTVLVVGAGGLGTAAAVYLAYSGVGRIIIVDDQEIELSNLNRQILYTEDDLGKPKALVACEKLRQINPHIEVECYKARFNREIGEKLVARADVVVDALDNWGTRLLLNELCVKFRKPLIHAAVEGFYIQLTTIIPGKTPCLYCIFGARRDIERAIPVASVTPGVAGVLEAAEALKILLKLGKPMLGRLLLINLLDMDFETVEVKRNPLCPVCGKLSEKSDEGI